MKFFPRVTRPNIENYAIVKQNGMYKFSESGVKIGELLLDREQAITIRNGNISSEILALVNENPEEIYFDGPGNLTVDKYDDKYKVGVYRRQSVNELPYGVFDLSSSSYEGTYFVPYTTKLTPGHIINNKTLKKDVLDFFNNKEDTGRKNKKGFLLFGAPGNGKTTEIMSLFSVAEEEKIRIFIVSRRTDLTGLSNLKKVLEADKTIFVFEELTQRTDADGTEELLTFLDGENSWNNSVTIATTNYPKQLPENLVDRPGRFDTFIEYCNPTKDEIMTLGYVYGFEPEQSAELNNKELSFDYVSFIMSTAKARGISIKEAVTQETEKKKKISNTFKSKMGMGI